jgi:hypothetical protein
MALSKRWLTKFALGMGTGIGHIFPFLKEKTQEEVLSMLKMELLKVSATWIIIKKI